MPLPGRRPLSAPVLKARRYAPSLASKSCPSATRPCPSPLVLAVLSPVLAVVSPTSCVGRVGTDDLRHFTFHKHSAL